MVVQVSDGIIESGRALLPYGASTDLLTYWQLAGRPFETTWDTRFFFPSRQHDEALSRLEFLANEQTMLLGLLTGEFGCGKTITRAVFTAQLDPQRYQVVTLENSAFSFTELLGVVMRALGADPNDLGRTKFARYDRFQRTVERLASAGRHLVLVFDEAQEMSATTLNELKLLTNLNTDGRSLLTVILVGQPELRSQLAKMPALEQRISLNFHLGPLGREETAAYLQYRLQAAGHPTGAVFSPEAAQLMFEVTQGVPRELNRLAKLTMEHAWACEEAEVTPAIVDTIAHDLKRRPAAVRA